MSGSIDATLDMVNLAKRRRKEEMASLSEAITVVEALKGKMEEEWQNIEKKTNNLLSLENKLRTMKSLSLEGRITVEVAEASFSDVPMLMELVRMEEETALELQLLERGLARSSVKIGFDKPDDLLTNLKAQDDSVSLRLCTDPTRDSEKIFMASFLLRQIFKDMISSRNPQFLNRRGATGSNAALSVRPPAASVRTPLSSSSAPTLSPAAKTPTPLPPRPTSSKSSAAVVSRVTRVDPALDRAVAISNRPRAFLKMQVENETPFRVVVELRPDLAPIMVDNFLKLCRGLKNGRGYKGSQIFRCLPDERIEGGDFEKNDGTGGHSAFTERNFLAEQVPLPDAKGAVRMKGSERLENGRCKVNSQFLIWLGDIEYKNYKYTLVFGRVVEGLSKLQEVSRVRSMQDSEANWRMKRVVRVIDCGQL